MNGTKCSHCKIFWYRKKDYKNKGNKRKVWVPVNRQSEPPPLEDQNNGPTPRVDEQGTLITKRLVARNSINTRHGEVIEMNVFEVQNNVGEVMVGEPEPNFLECQET